MAEILYHLPAGPFSLNSFLAHAIGLNAVSNVSEITPMLERLAELGLIRRVVDTNEWVVVKEADTEGNSLRRAEGARTTADETATEGHGVRARIAEEATAEDTEGSKQHLPH